MTDVPATETARMLVEQWLLEEEAFGIRVERFCQAFPELDHTRLPALKDWMIGAVSFALTAVEKERDELREALRPFAGIFPQIADRHANCPLFLQVKGFQRKVELQFATIVRARATLSKKEKPDG